MELANQLYQMGSLLEEEGSSTGLTFIRKAMLILVNIEIKRRIKASDSVEQRKAKIIQICKSWNLAMVRLHTQGHKQITCQDLNNWLEKKYPQLFSLAKSSEYVQPYRRQTNSASGIDLMVN